MTDFLFSQFSVPELYALGGLCFIILVLVVVDAVNYISLRLHKNEISTDKPPVSVVIIAQNDADFLRDNLRHFLKQDYPVFEVIVVDNCSYDDTRTVVGEYQTQYDNLRVTDIKPDAKFLHTKKLAVTLGMKAASYDIVLFSEANCRPTSPKWIDYMQSAFTPDVNVVLGYSSYMQVKSFKGRLVAYDRFLKNIRMLRFALKRNAFRGDGTNVGYRKEAYFSYNCFAGNSNLEEGYDSLPVRELSQRSKAAVVTHPDAQIIIDYINIVREWSHYKLLNYKSRKFFKSLTKFKLDFIPFLRFFLMLYAASLFLFIDGYLYVLAPLVFYVLMRSLSIKLLANSLNDRIIFVYSIFQDFIVGVISFIQYVKVKR